MRGVNPDPKMPTDRPIAQSGLSRRDWLRGTTALAVTAASAPLLPRQAAAAEAMVRGYGITTSQLKNWDLMEKSIGVRMQFTPTNSDIGVFMRDVMANDIGDTQDILVFEGGTEDVLGPEGVYATIEEDHPELKLWSRTSDAWKRSDLLVADGKQYGVPVIGNADSFGYFPAAIDADPTGEAEISWATMYESEKTRGRAAIDRFWGYSMTEMANYLKQTGKARIADPANMTPEEARLVADYAIERKRAGQFRTIHSAFEEQIQLLTNKEVDIINCWEPATKEANDKLGTGAVIYAYTVEGYYKWGHGAYVPAAAMQRDNADAIYKVLNYYLGGEYRANQARDRGYAGPNMDLGVQYAIDNHWPEADIALLKATEAKVNRKFEKPFFCRPTAPQASAMEEEWQRFLNA
jgi:putative spermidine/putrescine transport system substrate-binding protein